MVFIVKKLRVYLGDRNIMFTKKCLDSYKAIYQVQTNKIEYICTVGTWSPLSEQAEWS